MASKLTKPIKDWSNNSFFSKSEKGAVSRIKGYEVEQTVKTYLIKQGLKEVCSNYRCKIGEVDLILKEQETLIFTEIRYRKSTNYGSSIETVSRRKQTKIIRTAEHFLQSNPWSKNLYCRFDVVGASPSILNEDHCYNGLKINWIKDAFQI